MHVKALKVFCDVVGRRSFSRAADDNDMTQSGVSQIVHQLEDRLGVKLLDRSKRPFVLTAEGEVYYRGCRNLVQRYYALEERVRTLHEEVAGRVRVASIYSVGLSHMNEFVKQFMKRYPQAEIRLEYEHPERVYELVEADQVDFGLVSFPKCSRTLEAIAWREEPMMLVCAPDHPLAARTSASWGDLEGVELVGFDRNLQIRRESDRKLAAAGVDVRVVMEFDNIETLKRAIEIDAGVGLLPEPTVRREVQQGHLAALPLRGEPFVRPIGIIHRRGKELCGTAERFVAALRESGDAAVPRGTGQPTARHAAKRVESAEAVR
jgi:DNA-binding transcriptional LysR family regulator